MSARPTSKIILIAAHIKHQVFLHKTQKKGVSEPLRHMLLNAATEIVLLLPLLCMDTQTSLLAYLEGSRLDCTRVWVAPGLVWIPVREALPCTLKLSGVRD